MFRNRGPLKAYDHGDGSLRCDGGGIAVLDGAGTESLKNRPRTLCCRIIDGHLRSISDRLRAIRVTGTEMSTAPSFVTPLRYPGGKGRLGAWLAQLLKHNCLDGGLYVEPYAGGAGAAMYLLTNDHVERIAINDLDPVIHAFWWAVLNDAERFVEMIREIPVTMDTWHAQRAIIDDACTLDRTVLGFATFFLNRTNKIIDVASAFSFSIGKLFSDFVFSTVETIKFGIPTGVVARIRLGIG